MSDSQALKYMLFVDILILIALCYDVYLSYQKSKGA